MTTQKNYAIAEIFSGNGDFSWVAEWYYGGGRPSEVMKHEYPTKGKAKQSCKRFFNGFNTKLEWVDEVQ